MGQFIIKSRADNPELRKAAMAIEQAAWNQLGYLNYTHAHYTFYSDVLDQYPDYQLCLIDEESGYPIAVANCVPVTCPDDLPSEGWDWIVETAASGPKKYNMLGALAISVPVIHRHKGYARLMINAMQQLANQKGLGGVIAPVRPSAKSRHPFVPIHDYIHWSDERGRIYDPWIRSHVASGGKIVGPCLRSMVVEEPIAFWETWTQQEFSESGDYAVEGGLVPLSIDLDRQYGRYEEPNVWIVYH